MQAASIENLEKRDVLKVCCTSWTSILHDLGLADVSAPSFKGHPEVTIALSTLSATSPIVNTSIQFIH